MLDVNSLYRKSTLFKGFHSIQINYNGLIFNSVVYFSAHYQSKYLYRLHTREGFALSKILEELRKAFKKIL